MEASAPIPPPQDNDDEDVHWALSTASALWGRGEHAEALKWLRRAAEQASDANADTRALELFKAAAEVASRVNPPASQAPPPPSVARPLPGAGKGSAPPPPPPPKASAPPPASVRAPPPSIQAPPPAASSAARRTEAPPPPPKRQPVELAPSPRPAPRVALDAPPATTRPASIPAPAPVKPNIPVRPPPPPAPPSGAPIDLRHPKPRTPRPGDHPTGLPEGSKIERATAETMAGLSARRLSRASRPDAAEMREARGGRQRSESRPGRARRDAQGVGSPSEAGPAAEDAAPSSDRPTERPTPPARPSPSRRSEPDVNALSGEPRAREASVAPTPSPPQALSAWDAPYAEPQSLAPPDRPTELGRPAPVAPAQDRPVEVPRPAPAAPLADRTTETPRPAPTSLPQDRPTELSRPGLVAAAQAAVAQAAAALDLAPPPAVAAAAPAPPAWVDPATLAAAQQPYAAEPYAAEASAPPYAAQASPPYAAQQYGAEQPYDEGDRVTPAAPMPAPQTPDPPAVQQAPRRGGFTAEEVTMLRRDLFPQVIRHHARNEDLDEETRVLTGESGSYPGDLGDDPLRGVVVPKDLATTSDGSSEQAYANEAAFSATESGAVSQAPTAVGPVPLAPLPALRVAVLPPGSDGEMRFVALTSSARPPEAAATALLVPLSEADAEALAHLWGMTHQRTP